MSIKEIFFYSRDKDYGWLSNFARFPQVVDGIVYSTNEHFYQSRKAKDYSVCMWIASAPNPFLAMKIGRSLRPYEMVDWTEEKRVEVMLKGLRAKFFGRKDTRELLLATGSAILHENSPTDMFWGVKGKDMLGKLLMQVRDELK